MTTRFAGKTSNSKAKVYIKIDLSPGFPGAGRWYVDFHIAGILACLIWWRVQV
jgi:TM2 domain-containing membrane protein YozV